MCVCVHVLMQSRCSVRVGDGVYCVRCSVVTLLHIPHSHMHTPPQEDKCRLLPQPKPVPTEGGEREGEGEGEGEAEESLLNKMADQWMSTRDLMKVCVWGGGGGIVSCNLLAGGPWVLGQGLANGTTRVSWAGVPICSVLISR